MRPSEDLPDPTSCARHPLEHLVRPLAGARQRTGPAAVPRGVTRITRGRRIGPGQRETGPWRAERMAEGSATSKSSSTIGACRVRLVNARRDAQSGCTVTAPASRRSARLWTNFLRPNINQGRPRPKSKPPLTRHLTSSHAPCGAHTRQARTRRKLPGLPPANPSVDRWMSATGRSRAYATPARYEQTAPVPPANALSNRSVSPTGRSRADAG
jgi:hypothetical protein